MSAKKSLLISSLIIFICCTCGTAEARDNMSPAESRYGLRLIVEESGNPSTQGLKLSNPYWEMVLDAAGFADYLYWGPSPRPHVTGEMLSGEWAAAIYYDGISTESEAMWLTDKFICPDWTTNSDFEIFEDPNVWDDPQNPVDGNDTGYSVIRNNQEVEVRIDYEMVDLGVQGPNGEGGSPLAFRDDNGMTAFVYSERYVLLQTYTINNIGPNTINNLEFYQMLHGHPADEYNDVVHSAYETYPHFRNDPLENYTPYNPIHKTGKFLYDITQWNEPNSPDPNLRNWIGFSSTAEPNVYECGYFAGYSPGKPLTGTHISIEQRNLDSNDYSYGEVAGATGWYLGELEPNETVSLTFALALGAESVFEIPPVFPTINKSDNLNDGDCIVPGNQIDYTVNYSYPAEPEYYPDIYDVNIIDYLPDEVEFVSSVPPPNRIIDSNIIWEIGTLSPGVSNFITLTVNVKENVETCVRIKNRCEIKSGDTVLNDSNEITPVCCPMLTKEDYIPDINCPVPPDANITYNICYDANGYSDTNVVIIDCLPNEVNFVSVSNGGIYDSDSNCVRWDIGTIGPDDSDCLTLIVKINDKAKPGVPIENCCEMTGDSLINPVRACEYTTMGLIYVDANTNVADPNGLSWKYAYKYLQDALGALQQCSYNEIWVADGNYMPDRNSANPEGTGDREATFQLISGITIKGGFAGYGAENPDECDSEKYPTILNGDIGVKGNNSDNSYHVVTGSYTEPNAVLDGFTIKGGNANESYSHNSGGGMLNDSGSPTVINCTFSENSAYSGGGMSNDSSNPTVINCTFSGNNAFGASMGQGGGGMWISGNPNVTNCVFSGNSAGAGGGIYGSSPKITNCTFVGNTANSGGGLYGSQLIVVNCILWGNSPEQIAESGSSFTYCDIQDDQPCGWPGIGNINADPCFVDADGGNYHLSWNSPCIDAGDSSKSAVPFDVADLDGDGNITEPIPYDLDGLPRFIDDLCTVDTGNCMPPLDMGAYEFRHLDVLTLEKVDYVGDSNCADPNEVITYKIDYSYPAESYQPNKNDVDIIDYLPPKVNFVSASNGGIYNLNSHTVTWNIGTLEPSESGFVTLTVKVKGNVKPCSRITNHCVIRSGGVVLNGACEVPPPQSPWTCEEVYECGWALPADVNGDCYVNFKDYAIWANDWWRCLRYGYPISTGDPSCEHPWWDSVELCGSYYNVINIDLNGGPNDPIYSGTAAFEATVDTNCVIDEWNCYYQGEGVLMPSPRCEDIGEPCSPGTYARAIFIADPCVHGYINGEPNLLCDGFVKSGLPTDPNPGLFFWGTMAYGGVYDVYVLACAAGSFTITDSNGDTQSASLDGGGVGWEEGKNYIKFEDVEIDTPASRDASGPDPSYAAGGYLTDPNCVVLSYSNQINGIQFASVKRRIMNERGVPPGDANFTDGLWSVETPIILGTPPKRFNVFAGDYDAAYETNQLDGEPDYDGPDADWESGTMHCIDYQEQWEYDLIVDSTSDGAYKIRFLVNLASGSANFSIYIDNSSELGSMKIELNDGVDANIPYWSTDTANVTPTPGTGWLDINFFQGFHKLTIKANQTCFKLKGFQLFHTGNLPNMNTCQTVIDYGFGLAGDLNNDCYVNFDDLDIFVEEWLRCNNPEDPSCIVF